MKTIHTDILIVGGGAAGIAAATALTDSNERCVLIDSHAYLGGTATAVEVGTVCGLYKNGRSVSSEFIVSGFAKDFALNLQQLCGTQPLVNNEGLHFLPYTVEGFKRLGNDLLEKSGCTFFASTILKSVHIFNAEHGEALVEIKGEPCKIEFSAIIDCSGNAVVASFVQHPMIDAGEFQRAAITFTLSNVAASDEATLNFIMIRAIGKAVASGQLPSEFRKTYLVPGSLKNNQVSFKIGIAGAVTHSPKNVAELTKKGREMVQILVSFLSDQVDAFHASALDHIADEIGLRTGYRPVGKYVLTEQDVLSGAKFENSIADCCWPIEEWLEDVKVHMHYLAENDFYQIPEDCLQSSVYPNLFFAGKNISASHRAIGSARVMGICLQTGYAAGKLARAYAGKTKSVLSSQNN